MYPGSVPYKYVPNSLAAAHLRHGGPTTLPEQPPALGAGATIVCLHGCGGNLGFYDGIFEALEKEHSPVALDLPAHGRSGGIDSLESVEAMAAFVAEILDWLGASQPILVGHNLGAAIAVELASQRPLAGLVLCSVGAPAGEVQAAAERLRPVTEGKQRRAFIREHYAPDASNDVMRGGFMQGLKTDPRAELGDLLALAAWTPDLDGLELPTLLVHGAHDSQELVSTNRALETARPSISRLELADAAAMLPIEQPQALADAVLEFAKQVAA